MSINNKFIFFICFFLFFLPGLCSASCVRGPAKTIKLDMDIGKLVVSPEMPINSVIFEKNFRIPDGSKENYFYECTGVNNDFIGDLAPSIKGKDTLDKVYPTNIDGIGMRFSLKGGGSKGINITYYGSKNSDSGLGERVYFQDQFFNLQIIKTKQKTGSGSLTPGLYTFYNYKFDGANDPMLETYLTGSSVTIISPSCIVTSDKNMDINIGNIERRTLNKIGSTGGGREFKISLLCDGGVTEYGYSNVNATFSGKLATNTTEDMGVLINEKIGSSIAEGIGVQVLHNELPLIFNKKYLIGNKIVGKGNEIIFPLKAQFYRYGNTTSAGEVESHMIFNLTYD